VIQREFLTKSIPPYIRLRKPEDSYACSPLPKAYKRGNLPMCTDDQVVEEIKLFIQTLDNTITSTITSDHIMNLLEEVKGKLPDNKENMLHVIKKYQDLSESERIIYRIGRRGGVYSSTDDLYRDQSTYVKINRLVSDLSSKGADEIEQFINEMANRYV